MKIEISVIVPIYKAQDYIERCVNSLFKQSFQNIEFIFIDDGSPDDSVSIVKRVLNSFPNRKFNTTFLEHKYNLGSAAARSTGLKKVKGEYVIFCDSDDWIDTDLYSKMYNHAKCNDADIVACNFALIYNDRTELIKYNYLEESLLNIYEMHFDLLHSSLCNKLVKATLYSENNLDFYEGINMWEDVGIMSRLRYFSKKTLILKDSYYNYNKLNLNSIVSTPKEENIQQQLKCAELLAAFFLDKDKDFIIVANYLKFVAKSDYLFHSKIRNVSKWRSIFKESNKFIFHFNLPLNMKILAWLVDKKMTNLFYLLLSLKQIKI